MKLMVKELIRCTTPAEFSLAMHARQAAWAREFRDLNVLGAARTHARISREHLARYLAAKTSDLSSEAREGVGG